MAGSGEVQRSRPPAKTVAPEDQNSHLTLLRRQESYCAASVYHGTPLQVEPERWTLPTQRFRQFCSISARPVPCLGNGHLTRSGPKRIDQGRASAGSKLAAAGRVTASWELFDGHA